MKYKIEFQYKPGGQTRPLDYAQEHALIYEKGEYLPIPSVGDTASYEQSGHIVSRKVLTRHFAYVGDWCAVNIVVTDVPASEMAARLKM